MKKNIELNTYLLNYRYANRYTELGGRRYGEFIANMNTFNFKDGDYVTLAEITYGNIFRLAIYAGYDTFTVNEDGSVCNNPATDKKHYYIELMILANRKGDDDECLENVWFDEDYPNGIDETECFTIFDRLMDAARDYIADEINKLPSVWVVESDYCDSDRHTGFSVLFNNYEEAKAFFDEKVAEEQASETLWCSYVYNDYNNGLLDEEKYDVTVDDDTFAISVRDENCYTRWTLRRKEIL